MSSGIEQRVRKREQLSTLKTSILRVVAATGVLAVALAAPNTVKAIPQEVFRYIAGQRRNTRDVAVSRLVKSGYLVRTTHRGKHVLRITGSGLRFLEKERTKHALMRPGRWDKKWRIVAFDIGEKRRRTRDKLRRDLKQAQFYRLQDSMWIYPFPCEEFVALLKSNLHVGKDILYIVAEEVENARWLEEHFNLKR